MPDDPPALPERTCVACGKTDTDPKHGISPDGGLSMTYHHMECGPLMDPHCGTADDGMRICAGLIDGWDGQRGEGMRAHLRGDKQHTEKAGA